MTVAAIKILDAGEEATAEPDQRLAEVSKEFLLAGRAYFLVINPKGTRFAFSIQARINRANKDKFPGDMVYFLRVFRGGTYQYVGVVRDESGDIASTGRSEFAPGTLEFDVAQWALTTVFNGLPLKPGYVIRHNEKCGKCGKVLVTRGDRETGFHLDCTSEKG